MDRNSLVVRQNLTLTFTVQCKSRSHDAFPEEWAKWERVFTHDARHKADATGLAIWGKLLQWCCAEILMEHAADCSS
jgi:hypothetical protein